MTFRRELDPNAIALGGHKEGVAFYVRIRYNRYRATLVLVFRKEGGR
jgi:hypothetical protein